MILIPKYKEFEIDLGSSKISIQGEYRIIRYNCMGQQNYDTGWVKNLITDFGMTKKATGSGGSWMSYFHIGSGTTPPANSDTTMSVYLATSSLSQGTNIGNTPVAPNYEKWNQGAMRFNAGVGTGTINEVGFGSSNSNANICARQLVSPGISKASDEVVDVYWKITQYPDTTDRASTIVIDGITYDTIMRPLDIDFHNDYAGCWGKIGTYIYAGFTVSDNTLVAMTNNVLASNTINGASGDGYWDSSYGLGYQVMGHKFPLNSANLANGIRTMSFTHTGPNTKMQCQFTAQTPTTAANPLCIPKDNTKELITYWRADWVRH